LGGYTLLEVGKPYMVNDKENGIANAMVNHTTQDAPGEECNRCGDNGPGPPPRRG